MPRINGEVIYKRGRRLRGGQEYIIGYLKGTKKDEVRLFEKVSTDVNFRQGQKITIVTNGNIITVHNNSLRGKVTGTKF